MPIAHPSFSRISFSLRRTGLPHNETIGVRDTGPQPVANGNFSSLLYPMSMEFIGDLVDALRILS
jgi:hypothetical protein